MRHCDSHTVRQCDSHTVSQCDSHTVQKITLTPCVNVTLTPCVKERASRWRSPTSDKWRLVQRANTLLCWCSVQIINEYWCNDEVVSSIRMMTKGGRATSVAHTFTIEVLLTFYLLGFDPECVELQNMSRRCKYITGTFDFIMLQQIVLSAMVLK